MELSEINYAEGCRSSIQGLLGSSSNFKDPKRIQCNPRLDVGYDGRPIEYGVYTCIYTQTC